MREFHCPMAYRFPRDRSTRRILFALLVSNQQGEHSLQVRESMMTSKRIHCGPTPSPEAELTCRQVTALFVDYLAGDIESITRTAFETHLCHCQACTAFLATYRETIRATRAARDETIPELRIARVRRFLRRQLEGTPRTRRLNC